MIREIGRLKFLAAKRHCILIGRASPSFCCLSYPSRSRFRTSRPGVIKMETSGFQNKVALVTGASSGIGSAVATRLGRAGATVAVHYNGHEENAAAVASTITSAGGTAFIVGSDVAKVDDAKSIVKAVVDRCVEID